MTNSVFLPLLLAAALCAALAPAHAQSLGPPDSGKFLATGGVTQAEGAGGGGLVPWALITGYGTRDSYGANVHATHLQTRDFALSTVGAAFGWADRVEISFARQEFRGTDAALDGLRIRLEVAGLKLRLAGDAVYDQDRWLPQLAVGAFLKRNRGLEGLSALGITRATDLGARDERGTDYYVAATKILFDRSLLANATLRLTKANQLGLLGFGGDRRDRYQAQLEASMAYLATRHLAFGAEYRSKPRNLAIDEERDAWDLFVAWFPTKHLSITAAYVDLGEIVKPLNAKRQRGPYLSVQAGF